MEFYEVKNKLLRVLNTPEFMDSIDAYTYVEAIDVFMEHEFVTWENITDEVIFYIHCYHNKNNRDSDYDVYGFQLGVDGYLVDYTQTDITFHEVFPQFIDKEFDSEIYTNLVDAYIESTELCEPDLIPFLPDPIVKILNDSGAFESLSIEDKLWLYDKTKNAIFVKQEVLDIFIF